jgi:hypothetical protein
MELAMAGLPSPMVRTRIRSRRKPMGKLTKANIRVVIREALVLHRLHLHPRQLKA